MVEKFRLFNFKFNHFLFALVAVFIHQNVLPCHAVLTYQMKTNLDSAKERIEKGQFSEAFHYINLASSQKNPINTNLPLREQAETAVKQLSVLTKKSPGSMILNELRSECNLFLDRKKEAKKDLQLIVKDWPLNVNALLKLAKISYNLGELNDSLMYAKDCLKSDPDHKECFSYHKNTKEITKQYAKAEKAFDEKDYGFCVDSAEKMVAMAEELGAGPEITYLADVKLCKCLLHVKEYEEGLSRCSAALIHRSEPQILCDRGEIYLAMGKLGKASRDFEEALEMDRSFKPAKEGVKKVLELEKQNYGYFLYSILAVVVGIPVSLLCLRLLASTGIYHYFVAMFKYQEIHTD